MTRSYFLDQVYKCNQHMKLLGRDFVARVNPGASSLKIHEAERKLGFRLPPSMRSFLGEVNGADLFSLGRTDQFSTGLNITAVDDLFKDSTYYNEELHELFYLNKTSIPPFYLSPGGFMNEIVMMRISPNNPAPEVEPAVLLRHFEVRDTKWRAIATSFDDWLDKAFESMINTLRGFHYYIDSDEVQM